MDPEDKSLETLLYYALSLKDPVERERWLQNALGNAPEKLVELRELIDCHQRGDWMDQPLSPIQDVLKLFEDLTGKQIGPFVLKEKIGDGGMGDVYLAQQSTPIRRQVAVKLIRWDAEHQQIVARFQREKQMLASMEHPNIARIIDAGTTETGYSYIAMEYVKGQHLLDCCKQKQFNVRTRIELMLQCCLAIQHAHQKGVIHRDIKPNNVMVTYIDEQPVIKVIDFGIAKASLSDAINADNDYTSSIVKILSGSITYQGRSPGTPRYMSPEQFPNSSKTVDTRSDIYSLGALLYAVLTEKDPFDESQLQGTLYEIGEFVANNDPVLPSVRRPDKTKELQGDLDSIVRKAMHRDVEKRYQSVPQLAEDLQNFLSNQTVSTNPGTPWTHVWKFAQQNLLYVGASLLAVAGILVGGVVAETQRLQAVRAAQIAKHHGVIADLFAASLAIERSEYGLARNMLETIVSHKNDKESSDKLGPNRNRLDWRLLHSKIPSKPNEVANVGSKIYYGLAIQSLHAIACGCKNSKLYFFDQNSGREIFQCDTEQIEINGLAVSPDGKMLATAGDDGTVKFWDLMNQIQLAPPLSASSAGVFQVAWSNDGRTLYTVANESIAKGWTFPELDPVEEISCGVADLECLAMGHQGRWAFGDSRGTVRVCTQRDPQVSNGPSVNSELHFKNQNCSSLAFSPSGQTLAIGLNQGHLILTRLTKNGYQAIEQIQFPTDVTALSFSKNESQLAIGEANGSLHLLDLAQQWPDESRLFFTDQFFNHHREAFEGSSDKMAKLRELIVRCDPPEALEHLAADCDKVTIEFQGLQDHLLIRPEFLREWLDPSGNAQKHRYEIPIDVIPSGKSVQIRFPNHQRLWTDLKELQSNKRIESWAPHEKRISAIAWGTKNPELFTFSEDHSVKRLVVPTSRDRIIQTDGTAIFPLAANRCVIQTDGDPTYSMLEIGSEPIHTTDASSLLSDTIAYSQPFLQRDSLLIAKLAGTDPGGQRWSVDRWEASGKRSESIAKFPEDIWVELFFGSPLPERWLGRFCVWNGKSHQDQKSVFYGLWNSKESKFDWRTDENDEPFRHPDISRDGRYLIFESGSKISRVSTLDGTKITLVDLPGQSISCMKYSPDGKYIAVALTKPSAIHNYRASDGKLIWEIHPQGRPIEDLSWSMDQQVLVSLSLDGYLRTYDVVTQKISSQQLLPISNPKQLRLSLDEQSLFVLGGQGEILPILLPPTGESTKQR